MAEDNSRLVYSTEHTVPRKEKPAVRNIVATAAPSKTRTMVRLDRKSRGGKVVTLVEGLQLPNEESEKLLKLLKAKLGTGGAVKNNVLEIQGDHCDAICAELSGIGYRPKRSGG